MHVQRALCVSLLLVAGAMLADEARADGVELDRDMCVRSMRYLQSHFLDRDGKARRDMGCVDAISQQ